MLLGDVVDQFHDHNGFADARAAEQPDLAALQERLDQIHHLDAGFEHLGGGGLLVEGGRQAMDGQPVGRLDGAEVVHRLADHIHHSPQRAPAHRHPDGAAEVDGLHAAHHAVGGLHGDAAHAALAEVLLDFKDDVNRHRHVEAFADHVQRLVNGRQGGFAELHVHRRPGNLNHFSDVFCHMKVLGSSYWLA